MKAFVGVTDYEWFRFLRSRPELEEVNFWQPSAGHRFRALQPGEPFLFKLHAPQNAIAGGGFFQHYSQLPHGMAWDFFGESNGAASLRQMRQRIEKYRRVPADARKDYTIGCILLGSPFFFSDQEWIPVPEDWSANIVRGKGYDLTRGIGARLWSEVENRLRGQLLFERTEQREVYGEPVFVRPRLGQGTFRTLVTDTYQRHCAITSEKALPVLDAAHIQPESEGGRHEITNGLLLRSDLHRLFDRGYVTVTPDYEVRVSRQLQEDFDNGEPYYPYDGRKIWLPGDPQDHPSQGFLEWHRDSMFRG